MESISGNKSEKKTLLNVITKIRENLDFKQIVYHVGDSVFIPLII